MKYRVCFYSYEYNVYYVSEDHSNEIAKCVTIYRDFLIGKKITEKNPFQFSEFCPNMFELNYCFIFIYVIILYKSLYLQYK